MFFLFNVHSKGDDHGHKRNSRTGSRCDVKFVCIICLRNGAVKSVDAPFSQLDERSSAACGSNGSSSRFSPYPGVRHDLRLDTDTYAVLPWTPPELRRARIFCDIYQPDGTPFPGDPRGTLKRHLEKLKQRGWIYNIGPEPEFFLFRQNGSQSIHPVPHDVGGYFDFSPNDEAVRVRTELMEALDEMGLESKWAP